MAEHNELGKAGESTAAKFLEKNGYTILKTNWHWRNSEVDIIAQKNDLIVFAEVKTRTTSYFGEPEVFVTRTKQKSYITAANAYVQENNCNQEVRFDIIAITSYKEKTTINHIEGAFSSIL